MNTFKAPLCLFHLNSEREKDSITNFNFVNMHLLFMVLFFPLNYFCIFNMSAFRNSNKIEVC